MRFAIVKISVDQISGTTQTHRIHNFNMAASNEGSSDVHQLVLSQFLSARSASEVDSQLQDLQSCRYRIYLLFIATITELICCVGKHTARNNRSVEIGYEIVMNFMRKIVANFYDDRLKDRPIEIRLKVLRFNSIFYSPSTEAVDAFSQNWADGNNLFPPPLFLKYLMLFFVSVKAESREPL